MGGWAGRVRRRTLHIETSVDIDAKAADVWSVLVEVERWPEWTESVSEVQRLDTGGLTTASKVRLKQPRLPAMVWRVTEIEPPTSFSWSASGGGVTTTAGHLVRAGQDGTVRVTLSIDQHGPMARVLGLFTSGLTRRYLHMEAQGLKRRCEA